MWAYRHAGYFAPGDLEALISQVSAAAVTWPARILTNFAARYSR
jgi:GMP synthase (glutamine-hydrolysing)